MNVDPAEGFLDRLADPNDESAREWDREHDRHVLKKLLAIVRPDFGATTWETFQRFALEGRPAAQVAAELGMTENAVIQAKSRILRNLREEAGELVDSNRNFRDTLGSLHLFSNGECSIRSDSMGPLRPRYQSLPSPASDGRGARLVRTWEAEQRTVRTR